MSPGCADGMSTALLFVSAECGAAFADAVEEEKHQTAQIIIRRREPIRTPVVHEKKSKREDEKQSDKSTDNSQLVNPRRKRRTNL